MCPLPYPPDVARHRFRVAVDVAGSALRKRKDLPPPPPARAPRPAHPRRFENLLQPLTRPDFRSSPESTEVGAVPLNFPNGKPDRDTG